MEQITLYARWGDRKETLDQCTNRALCCLQGLGQCDPLLTRWFQLGRSRREALGREFDGTYESCQTLLERGRIRRDLGERSVMEDLGYGMSLWNGGEEMSAVGIRIRLGKYPNNPEIPAPNECVIEFPTPGVAADNLLIPAKLRLMADAMARAWDPDWMRLSTFEMDIALYGREFRKNLRVGWISYLSDRYGPLPALPEQFLVMRVDARGSLIVMQGVDRIRASQLDQVETLRTLSDSLRLAGLHTSTSARKV